MVNILLIGNGAREHVIAETFRRSPQNPKLFSYMKSNNPGIAQLSEKVMIGDYKDMEKIKQFAKDSKSDFAFIGPEDPLNNGVTDELLSINIPVIGPTKKLAQLETSKSFTRELLTKYHIPANPRYKIFTTKSKEKEIEKFLEDIPGFVIKPDGLTGGKGVKVQGDHLKTNREAIEYCREVLSTHPRVIVEEKLDGEEFSVFFLTDGKTVLPMPPAQDHKRAFIDDTGPNTGGMGSYSDANHSLPFLRKSDIDDALAIARLTAQALLVETKEPYRGVMYGGFIATDEGVKLIEYNARFGDPEVMNILPLLKTDFVDICQAIVREKLNTIKLEFENKATVCKYLVPDGYPSNPVSNEKITIGKIDPKAKLYYSSVDQRKDGLYLSSSRSIAIVGISDTIGKAEKLAETAIIKIKGKVFHRPDIGTKKLIQKRIDHMKRLRPD